MKRIILLTLLMLAAASAFSQATRVDIPLQTYGPNVPTSSGALPQALWSANAIVYLCTHPSPTLAACKASLIQTYTDSTETTPCPSASQLVQLPGTTCTAGTGAAATIGAWVPVTTFDYWVTVSYGSFGPYTFSPNGVVYPITVPNGGTGATTTQGAATNISNGTVIDGTVDASSSIFGGSLSTAIAATPAGGTLHFPSSYSYTLSSMLTVSSPITFKCDPGATFIHGSGLTATAAFNVTANNVIFDGCTLNANSVPVGTGIGSIEVNVGVTGFTFKNGSIINSRNYGVRLDGVIGAVIDNNYVNVLTDSPVDGFSGSFCTFYGNTAQPIVNARITRNWGIGGCDVESPGPGGNALSFTFSGNTLTVPLSGTNAASAGTAIFTAADFSSAQTSLISNFVVDGNTCNVAGTSVNNQVFGCFSIAIQVANCAFTNNTLNGVGQYIGAYLLEFGGRGCTVAGNSFNAGADPGTQTYFDMVLYTGQNTISGNTFNGWASQGKAIQEFVGSPSAEQNKDEDGNTFSDNTLTADSSANPAYAYGISIVCAASGWSANNQVITGGSITGALLRAIDVESFSGCPASAQIGDVTIVNATNGIATANVHVAIGNVRYVNVANPTEDFGGTIYETSVVQSQFTPAATGWYRLIHAVCGSPMSGTFNISTAFGTSVVSQINYTIGDFQLAGYGQGAMLNIRTISAYTTFGPIDQIQTSSDGSNNCYLDLHVSTITGAQPITVTYSGGFGYMSGIQTTPALATPGTYSIANFTYPSSIIGSNTVQQISAARTGYDASLGYIAGSKGFSQAASTGNPYDPTNAAVVLPPTLTGYHGGTGDTKVQLGDGTGTSGNCAKFDATGGLTDSGGACGGGGGAVSSWSGDGALYNNAASTGVVTATLANAGAHKWWGNNTGSTAAPGYQAIGTGDLPAIPLSGLATQTANTVVGNGTSGSASPTALTMPSCSGASNALTWTTSGGSTAFGCNTISNATTISTTGGVVTNSTFYPLFVASNSSSNQAVNTGTNFQYQALAAKITLGVPFTTGGQLSLADAGSANTVNINVATQSGNFSVSIPGVTAADTFTTRGLAQTFSALNTFSAGVSVSKVLNTAAQTTVSCSTSGSAIFSQPQQGSSDKKVLIHLAACLGTASYTYPTAFTNSPSCYASSLVACTVAGTISASAVTVTGATSTGSLVLEDY